MDTANDTTKWSPAKNTSGGTGKTPQDPTQQELSAQEQSQQQQDPTQQEPTAPRTEYDIPPQGLQALIDREGWNITVDELYAENADRLSNPFVWHVGAKIRH